MLIALSGRERENLVELFFRLRSLAAAHPPARQEVMTALRCLKAVHSNAIEDKSIDRIFLQILLHGAGVPDKGEISEGYRRACLELRGQQAMLEWLESEAPGETTLSNSLLLEMHRRIFQESWPEAAGKFRQEEVRIAGMSHRPPHPSKVAEILHQRFQVIQADLEELGEVTPENFFAVLDVAARAHYLVAHVHPFPDGNGRLARALGDFVMLKMGMFYDVIMTDYRDAYLDSLVDCTLTDCSPLARFQHYSYLETLQRISTFFRLLK